MRYGRSIIFQMAEVMVPRDLFQQILAAITALRPMAPGVTRVQVTGYTGDSYRARYSAQFDCLLRIAVPYFPGWAAAVDGKSTPVYAVDDALSGVFVPAGEHEVTFQYRSNWFAMGAAISGLALAGLILSSAFLLRRR